MLLPARTGAAAVASTDRRPWPFEIQAEKWLVIAVTALAAVLRFVTLTTQSYWLDEAQAVHELHLSFGAMLHAWSSFEWNPPLYLLIAWPWAKLFGTGEFGLRALSALLGTAVVPLLYLAGRELISRRAGLVAAALAAVNPFLIDYSQQAREYALLLVLCTASVLFFARAWRRPRGTRELVWWAVISILALLTQYYAGFLVAAEGVALVWRTRSRVSVLALGATGLVELALIPHVIPRLTEPVAFIVGVPLSERIQQVPVAFGLSTLDQSGLVSYGLLGAAVLAAAVIALLVIGGSEHELRGAGIAAALAAVVLLVPLAMSLIGHDDYVARGLMPAWIPLALTLGAACTARDTRAAGAALAVVLLAVFVYGLVRIGSDPRAFQQPNWRGVAAALGPPRRDRAIVAYDGEFAAAPLSIYLRGVAWAGPGQAAQTQPVTVSEVDIVGNLDQQAYSAAGARLIGWRAIDGIRVARFSLTRPWKLTPYGIGQQAPRLLGRGASNPSVMIQRQSA